MNILDEFRDLCFDRPNFLSKNSDYWNYSQKIIEKEENKKLECKMWMPSIKVIDDKNLRELKN